MRRHAVLVEVLSKANFEQGIGYQKVTLGSMAKRGESEMGGEKANEGSVKKRTERCDIDSVSTTYKVHYLGQAT